jgi:hypothetical protein
MGRMLESHSEAKKQLKGEVVAWMNMGTGKNELVLVDVALGGFVVAQYEHRTHLFTARTRHLGQAEAWLQFTCAAELFGVKLPTGREPAGA